jgi:DNA polymerase-3 subunit alpha
MSDFVHLHLHTDYSMMDGCQKPAMVFDRLKELEMNKVAITNHGNVINMPYMIEQGAKKGIQVIPGCEFYVCWDHSALIKDTEHKKTFHMVVLAMNNVGYKNLLKLSTLGHLVGKYHKPRIDREMLEQHNEGLIVLTACLNGTLANQIGKGGKCPADLVGDIQWFKEVFGDRVYLEIQRHPNLPENDLATEGIIELAKIHDMKLVATCDAHYSRVEHFNAWQSMMLLQTNFRFGHELQNDYYIKSHKQMADLFLDYPQAVEETAKIAERCTPITFDKSIKYPPFDTGGLTSHEYLKKISMEGLDKRIAKGKIVAKRRKEYEDRLNYECKVLAEKNFSTYMLIVSDFITWAKSQGIRVGPGRGSAAGCLVAYLTSITEVEPMKPGYDLIFERFINPERDSFPDVDTDFDDLRREEVIDYVTQKYGAEHVSRILTIVGIAAKGAIREIARRYELPPADTNIFSKMIPGLVRGRATSLKDAPLLSPDFKAKIDSSELYRKIFETALVIEGMAKSTGTHPAGVIFSDAQPLKEHIGLQLDKHGNLVTSDSQKTIEDLGFIKMDFLGLRQLSINSDAVKRIKINHQISIDLDDIDMDDIHVYKDILWTGQLAGIFQLSGSSGFKQVTTTFKPLNIPEISDINAIYRPGPLDNGFVEKYDVNKQKFLKGQAMEYMMKVDNPAKQKEIEAILKPTYGVCLYQEQIQFIAQRVAGYTLGGADLLRRAIGKKLPAEMEVQKQVFVDGCKKNGISGKSAVDLFTQIEKFADYCFNKSHSIAYSIITYQTAWLKKYYPAEFYAANLTAVADNRDKTIQFLASCRDEQITILPPSIQSSNLDYTTTPEGIRFGLNAIKGIGASVIVPIVEERTANGKFTSFFNFMTRMKGKGVDKASIATLIECGTFEELVA